MTVSRDVPFSLRVSEEAKQAYEEAAARSGLSLSEWARIVLDAASGFSRLDEQLARARAVRVINVGDLNPEQADEFMVRLGKLHDKAKAAGERVEAPALEALVNEIRAKGRKVRDGRW